MPADAPRETILANARVVTLDRVFRGTVFLRDGLVEDIVEGSGIPAGAEDCEGDFLIPGLVELHTDNLERHLHPRQGVQWPRRAAVAAHDGEFASVGVTTILDALRLGVIDENDDPLPQYAAEAAEAIDQLRPLGLLRADHFLHLRCELNAPGLIAEVQRLGYHPRLRLISLMDHTPGQRQFANLDRYIEYYQGRSGLSDAEMEAFIARACRLQAEHGEPNRAALATLARQGNVAVASHDDATADHVAESAALGATIAEFPTTIEAARASRSAGLSHSGNVSAMDMAAEGLVDILSSDYAPASLMLAAFKLAEDCPAYDLPAAIATVTANPARAVGLNDRGRIAVGLRADVARVYHVERLCVVRALWRAGARVM
jgi:alpha-D-ribose 1-methylphosphonate 5-triphosphate diphosphatase